MWPLLLDYTKDECVRMLREMELGAYAGVVSTFRAQGNLTAEKKKLLKDLQDSLSISLERHQAEIRRVSNDEKLNTIAHYMSGPSNSSEWIEEGKRLIPLLPRLVPQTAFYGLANSAAGHQMKENELMPPPTATQNKRKLLLKEREEQEAKRLREENQNITVTRKPVPSVPRVKSVVPSGINVQTKPTRIHFSNPTKQNPPTVQLQQQPNAPRVILVTSTAGGGFIPVSTITSSTHTYSKTAVEKRPLKATVKSPVAETTTIKQPMMSKGVHSQKVYVVPSTAGKSSFTTIPVPGNLKGLQFSTAPSGMIIPGSGTTGLTFKTFPGNNVIGSKPNLIIMPSKPHASMASSSSIRPIIVSGALNKSPQQRAAVATTENKATVKVPEVVPGSSSNVTPDRTKAKANYNISNASNVIEIQATGDAIQNLMRKGTLSQDFLDLVQKAVSMSGNQAGSQPVVVQQTSTTVAPSITSKSPDVVPLPSPCPVQQSQSEGHQLSMDSTTVSNKQEEDKVI